MVLFYQTDALYSYAGMWSWSKSRACSYYLCVATGALGANTHWSGGAASPLPQSILKIGLNLGTGFHMDRAGLWQPEYIYWRQQIIDRLNVTEEESLYCLYSESDFVIVASFRPRPNQLEEADFNQLQSSLLCIPVCVDENQFQSVAWNSCTALPEASYINTSKHFSFFWSCPSPF